MSSSDESPAPGQGWIDAPDATPVAEQLELDDIDVLAEVTHPIRGAIIGRLRSPRTVAEIAAMMDVPVTRLYHHVNKLVDSGLIQVVATRQVAAVTERRYQTVAHHYSISDEALERLDPRELAMAIGGVFDLAKIRLQRTIEVDGIAGGIGTHGTLSLAEKHLSPAARDELVGKLTALVADTESDLDETDPDAIAMTVLVAAFRSVD